jgi:hypothetical protein
MFFFREKDSSLQMQRFFWKWAVSHRMFVRIKIVQTFFCNGCRYKLAVHQWMFVRIVRKKYLFFGFAIKRTEASLKNFLENYFDRGHKQGDQMNLRKNYPTCSPTHYLSYLIHMYLGT